MQHAVKGAILSGLVLPGLGQIVLKYYLRGGVYLLITLGVLAAVVLKVVRIAGGVIDTLDASLKPLALDQIGRATDQLVAQFMAPAFGRWVLVLGVVWLMSTVDAYLLGRRKDAEAVASGAAPADEGHEQA